MIRTRQALLVEPSEKAAVVDLFLVNRNGLDSRKSGKWAQIGDARVLKIEVLQRCVPTKRTKVANNRAGGSNPSL